MGNYDFCINETFVISADYTIFRKYPFDAKFMFSKNEIAQATYSCGHADRISFIEKEYSICVII